MAAGRRRRSGLIFILLALILIVVLAFAAFFLRDQFLPTQPAAALPTATPQQELANIVILTQPISRGAAITEGAVSLVPYPKNQLVEGLFFTDTQQVINKRAKFDLEQGTPLTPSLIVDSPVGSFASFNIPRGMVAISIPISRLTSVSYALQPGDHVNLIASMLLVDIDPNFQTKLPNSSASVIAPGPTGGENSSTKATITIDPAPGTVQGRAELDPTLNQAIYVLPSEAQRARMVSQTLVQDSVVLWVGEFPLSGSTAPSPSVTPTPAAAEGETQQQPTEPTMPEVVSLVVTPQDAVTLNYLMLAGAKLNIALRSSGDDQRIPTEAVTLQFILDQYSIPNPAKLPYGMEPRLDTLNYPGEEISITP